MASLVYEDFPGTTTEYKVNFEYLEKSDVNVGAITEDTEGVEILTPITQGWSWKDDTTIEFTQAPGGVIRIYRVTNVDENYATFYPTVAIRALDLNNNQDQAIFAIQELQSNQKLLDEKYEDIRGPEGPAGPEGPDGPDGPTGPKGDDGINLEDGTYDPNNPPVCDTAGEGMVDASGNIWLCNGEGTWVNSGPVQGPPGPEGDKGDSSTVAVGTTATGAEGEAASVTNSGTLSNAVLDFSIPRGTAGSKGDAATVDIGSTTTGEAGTAALVSRRGTINDAIFDFTIPQGAKGEDGISPTGPYVLLDWNNYDLLS